MPYTASDVLDRTVELLNVIRTPDDGSYRRYNASIHANPVSLPIPPCQHCPLQEQPGSSSLDSHTPDISFFSPGNGNTPWTPFPYGPPAPAPPFNARSIATSPPLDIPSLPGL